MGGLMPCDVCACSRPASLSCLPGSKRKGVQKLEINQESRNKKSSSNYFRKSWIQWKKTRREIGKRKKVSSKVRERVSKVEFNSNHKIESGKGEGAGKRESQKGGKEFIHFAATTSLTPREKEWKYEAELERSGQTRIGFTAWGLRESEKRNQEIGNSRESNVRESSGTADSEYPWLVFTQLITRS